MSARAWPACALLLFFAWPFGGHAPTYAELRAKIAQAQGPKRAELLAQLGLLDYARARQSFDAGQSVQGRRDLTNLEDHARQAMDLLRAEAANGRKNGMKNVEIAFRQTAFGLGDLAHEANFPDQAPIAAAKQWLSNERQVLLQWMFAGKKQLRALAASEAKP